MFKLTLISIHLHGIVRRRRSQKFYLNIYTYTKLSNIFLDITFNRLNVMKIYMYSLYVYIYPGDCNEGI